VDRFEESGAATQRLIFGVSKRRIGTDLLLPVLLDLKEVVGFAYWQSFQEAAIYKAKKKRVCAYAKRNHHDAKKLSLT